MKQKFVTLTSTFATLKDKRVVISNEQADAAQQKKQARIRISLEHASDKLGFIHGALLELNNRYFIIAGPSGVGKTTVAEYLVKNFGATIVANDWLAVQVEKRSFFCSDLNFPGQLKHKKSCKLAGLILLQEADELKRDAYTPNISELEHLLGETFDGLNTPDRRALIKFWVKNQTILPFYCAIPTKHTTPGQTGATVLLVMQRSRPINEAVEVGIIGVGSVGSHLAYELGKLPFVTKVHLYDHTLDKIIGYSLDLNQAIYEKGEEVFVAHNSPENVFRRSSAVFICFRERNAEIDKSLPERWQRVKAHTKLAKQYVAAACKQQFSGAIFVVTNPVDFLAFAFYDMSQEHKNRLRTFQVYGVGLECDMARALFYGKQYSPTLQRRDIQLYGSHDDEYRIDTPLNTKKAALLKRDVDKASETVRSYGDIRTVYGPIAGVMRTYLAYANSDATLASTIQSGAYMGGYVEFKFGIPCLPDQKYPASYTNLLEENKKKVVKYKDIL